MVALYPEGEGGAVCALRRRRDLRGGVSVARGRAVGDNKMTEGNE